MLQWNEPDFIDFFNSLCEFDETAHSHTFSSVQDDIRVVVTLIEYEGTVYVDLFRATWDEPLITIRRDFCSHAQITKDASFRCCFEAGKPDHPVTNMGIPPVLTHGVRVYVEPHVQIELIEKHYDTG